MPASSVVASSKSGAGLLGNARCGCYARSACRAHARRPSARVGKAGSLPVGRRSVCNRGAEPLGSAAREPVESTHERATSGDALRSVASTARPAAERQFRSRRDRTGTLPRTADKKSRSSRRHRKCDESALRFPISTAEDDVPNDPLRAIACRSKLEHRRRGRVVPRAIEANTGGRDPRHVASKATSTLEQEHDERSSARWHDTWVLIGSFTPATRVLARAATATTAGQREEAAGQSRAGQGRELLDRAQTAPRATSTVDSGGATRLSRASRAQSAQRRDREARERSFGQMPRSPLWRGARCRGLMAAWLADARSRARRPRAARPTTVAIVLLATGAFGRSRTRMRSTKTPGVPQAREPPASGRAQDELRARRRRAR